MGIQINGQTDIISATDGGLTVQGTELSGNNINVTGIITATSFSGDVTGNVNSTGVSTFSGGVVVAAGTTAAPSISPTGDSNTGIFFPSADTIAFAEGGSEALRVTSSGDIGIGTATPSNYFSYDLVVKSRQNTGGITIAANSTSDTNYLMFADGTSGNAAYRGYINYAHSDDSLNIASAGSVRATLTSTGNLQIANGNLVFSTSGTGIDFSATANSSGTMTSELLDDYEEGTWTPNFSNVSYTPTVQFGRYTKIGRYVYCTITIDGNSLSGSGTIGLEGLPFTAAETGDNQQRSAWHPANGGHMVGLSINDARFRINGSTMDGVKGATGSTTYMTGSQLTSGTFQFTGDFSYYTS